MAKKKIHRNRIDTLSQEEQKKREKENALIFFLDASKLVHVLKFPQNFNTCTSKE